ncbi:RNA polymerase subunit sigma-70 [Idiomarina tyrosinivorans]|uniref:RNA polymerase sigma factor n=1 Tax=Idiomarina tyrosinivorans TaxID=1445662 RepID=A0A432ZS20_9GAMM|nr:sigma-70 family RNA polymerase sigma factor [Idiomarina tyrosinivorans]RUO80714.1 RNA polymerase subunit sigma-70 [Idiomarina tyrosinivorans]
MLAATDEHLVQKALSGNKNAWLKLVKRYEKLVYHYAFRMVSNREDALDLLQDTFISVFRNLASWRQDASFKTWLLTIAHHRCVEFYRRKKDFSNVDEQTEAASEDEWHDPEMSTHRQQQGQQLTQAMQLLPLEQRTVVELKFYQHLTLGEIADQLGISTNTVKSRLYTAVAKLQQHVEVSHA